MTSPSRTRKIRLLYEHYYRRMRRGRNVNLYGAPTQLEQHCITQAFTSFVCRHYENNGWGDQTRRQRFYRRRLIVDYDQFGPGKPDRRVWPY